MRKFKNLRTFNLITLLFVTSLFISCEFLEEASTGLTDSEIVEGLKEALDLGLENSITSASSLDGYLGNELIKVLLPDEVVDFQNQIEDNTILSTAYAAYILIENDNNDLFSDLVTAMNRGAEQAATKASPIFKDAILEMTFDDAKGILEGGNDQAATEFFQTNTSDALVTAFSPDVKEALDDTNASALYETIVGFLNYEIIFVGSVSSVLGTNPDLPATLEEYATTKAVDGLFVLVGQEEEKIREDPFAWGNSIIEKVFGSILE